MEDKLNKAILEAKKSDTKKKRQQEKNIVMRWYRSNINDLKKIFDLHNLIVEAKKMVIRKLQQARSVFSTFLNTENGMRATNPEGFVAVDHLSGNAIKLVDRLEFSQSNMNTVKDWKTA
jgi:hypothetical protein